MDLADPANINDYETTREVGYKAAPAWHPYRNAWEAAQAERAKREEEERQKQVERMTRLIAKRGAWT